MAEIQQPTTVRMAVADLKPSPYNPRRIDDASLHALGESIERFGLVEPIIWNKRSGRVVGGHQRLRVLREANVSDVDVVQVDLDDNDEKALNIALNSPLLEGKFTDNLQDLLDQIQSANSELFEALRLDQLGFLDVAKAWEGMPEFDLDELAADSQVIVSFKNKDARQKFSELIGQQLTDKTRSIWYPPDPRLKAVDKEYTAE